MPINCKEVFESRIFGKMYVVYFDVRTNEWMILHNDGLQIIFQQPDTMKEIKKKKKEIDS